MLNENIFHVGEWLVFEANTCFGGKQHIGVIVGHDRETGELAVAVSATSQFEKRLRFCADNRWSYDTLVEITGIDGHFLKEPHTLIDCNMAKLLPMEAVQEWMNTNLVKEVEFNVMVDPEIFAKIRNGILISTNVPEPLKRIIRQQD